MLMMLLLLLALLRLVHLDVVGKIVQQRLGCLQRCVLPDRGLGFGQLRQAAVLETVVRAVVLFVVILRRRFQTTFAIRRKKECALFVRGTGILQDVPLAEVVLL